MLTNEINFETLESYPINKDAALSQKIGHAYIFSNENFNGKGCPPQKNNKHDEEILKGLFDTMGFAVNTIRKDYSEQHCENELKEIAKGRDLNGEECRECLLIAFISYGSLNEIRMQDKGIELKKIIEIFQEDNCEYLRNKPKIFVFQVGKRKNKTGSDSTDADAFRDDLPAGDNTPYDCVDVAGNVEIYMPKGADFIFCYPTSSRHVAHRSTEKGSFFVDIFANVMYSYLNDKSATKLDFETLLTVISKNISEIKADQNPWFSSTMRRQLYFNKSILSKSESDSKKESSGCMEFKLERYILSKSLESNQIGKAYIFSNEVFDEPDLYQTREGNQEDVKALYRVLSRMGFKTEILQDYNLRQCQQKLDDIASKEVSSEDSCLLIAFLSHGTLEEVRMKNRGISVKYVMEEFTEKECQKLENKPKIFLFQTCLGTSTENYCNPNEKSTKFIVEVETQKKTEEKDGKAKKWIEKKLRKNEKEGKMYLEVLDEKAGYMPIEKNFICCHATTPGYVSYRNKDGSFFIQEFANVFSQYLDGNIRDEANFAETDFVSLMKLVSKRVSNRTAEAGEFGGKKQVPWFMSSLKKQLYFDKAGEQGENNPN